MKKKYLIVDTESNGPEAYAEIWQIAWVTTDSHANVIKTDGGYLEPRERMKPIAKKITRFTRAELKNLSEPADGLYRRLLKDLRGCKAIIGHSVDQDIARMIHDSKRRCSEEIASKVKAALKSIPYYDTMSHTITFVGKTMTRGMWYHGRFGYVEKPAYPSLIELSRRLEVSRDGIVSHTADGDTELTRRCLAKMLVSHRELVKDLVHNKIVNPYIYY